MVALITPTLERRLRSSIKGRTLFDAASRGRYSTDASHYQQTPAGVVVPASADDLITALTIAREEHMPVTPRGGGTSQCGQTINSGLIVDCSEHLNHFIELDASNRRCTVQPGIVLDELNRILKPHGLWFPVDISTASRATLGGMAANNSCGGRSLRYGTMRDNVLSIDAILADGSHAHFGPHFHDGKPLAGNASPPKLVDELLKIGANSAADVREHFPKVHRRVGGYNVDALLPGPEINLSHILVGSEGTLGFFTKLELKLSPVLGERALAACHFGSFRAAMDSVQHLVKLNPIAVELVDRSLIELGHKIPLFNSTIQQFVRGAPEAILLVEFAETPEVNRQRMQELTDLVDELGIGWDRAGERWGGVTSIFDPRLQSGISEVRTAGLNIMMSMKDQGKPISFIEDCAVPLPHLAQYTGLLTEIFHRHGTRGTWYAHAAAGCLHVRPILNLRLDKDLRTMRQIAEEAFDLVRTFKGSHSGEHGDGILRSEFHERMFGARLTRVFESVKDAFDPKNLCNPGRIVRAPKFDDRSLLRYNKNYRPIEIPTALDWSEYHGSSGGFQGALEMCNNNGACRKLVGGVMCPSYRITGEERHVTRGRANTLRLAFTQQLGSGNLLDEDLIGSLKLCVSCKACRRECPTGVDMARFKIEVLAARSQKYGLSLRDRVIAWLPRYASYLAPLAPLLNLRNSSSVVRSLDEHFVGFSARRKLPTWRRKYFRDVERPFGTGRKVVLFIDTFNRYFEPENVDSAIAVLTALGNEVHIATPPAGNRPLCCGRTFLSVGRVDEARWEASRVVDALRHHIENGTPIVGLEPSCILSFRDEIPNLLSTPEVSALARLSRTFEEYLIDINFEALLPQTSARQRRVLLHGHCHQKSFSAFDVVKRAVTSIPNITLETIESSCCGMAGSFGYASETADASLAMAELSLFPKIRSASADAIIVADGVSCRQQIASGTPRNAQHFVHLLASYLREIRMIP